MEQIMKRRHPNSLPSLIMTAAAVPDEGSTTKTPYIMVLESKVKKLEVELSIKDQDEEKMLRSVEQKYLNIKVGMALCVFATLRKPGDFLFLL